MIPTERNLVGVVIKRLLVPVAITVSIKRPCPLQDRDNGSRVAQSSHRHERIADALSKMLRFGAQWFGEFYLWQQDIAAAIIERGGLRMIKIHVLTQDRFFVYSLVVNRDFIVSDVVINNHLARADDNHFAHLLRVEPTHVNIGNYLGWILQVQEYDVVNSILHIGHALARYRNGFRITEPILNDADVMRSEIPQRVNIRTDAAEVKPLAIDI